MQCELDHLVLAARKLDEGVAWCEATLGIVPGPGGKHALMGTHNRVFAIGSKTFPRAYFEVIAIDPDAALPGRKRWFDLDDAALQATLARGPRLVHWVARTAALDAAVSALASLGVEAGSVLQASRATPQGELRWRIAVRDDGLRLFGGALPRLIEWGTTHPTDALPASGVTLVALTLGAGDAPALQPALRVLGLAAARADDPALRATLDTPRGTVTLLSPACDDGQKTSAGSCPSELDQDAP
jgi:hypothetical protein